MYMSLIMVKIWDVYV